MPTRRTEIDHIGSCKFKVEISGIDAGRFTSVDGIEATTEVISFTDGDDMLIRKRPGRTNYSNLILRKGYIGSMALWDWFNQATQGNYDRKNISIILLDEAGNDIIRYNIYGAWPCRWKSFVLDAIEPGVMVEEIEIAIEKVERA